VVTLRRTLLALVALAAIYHCWWFSDFTVDDAAISFRYAQNFAAGDGLVLYPGGERVEGYSNFLWVVLLAAGVRLGVDLFRWSHLLGGALVVATVLGAAELCAALRRKRTLLDVAPALLTAALTPVSYWAMGGLEGALYSALVIWCAVRLVREADEALLHPLSALAAAGCALTRPDGLLVLLVAATTRVATDRRLRSVARWCLLAFAPVLLHFAWRYRYYAWPWPNTFYAKVQTPLDLRGLLNFKSEGWRYVFGLLARYRLEPAFAAAALVVLPWRTGTRWLSRVGLVALLAALCIFPVYARGDWMPEGRFLVAALPLVSALAVASLVQLAASMPRGGSVIGALLAIALVGASVPPSLKHSREQRGNYPVPASFVAVRGRFYHDIAARRHVADPSALDGDLGGTSLNAGMPIVDLGTLSDVTLARYLSHPTVTREYVHGERRPTFMRLTGFWLWHGLQDYPEFVDRYLPSREHDDIYIDRSVYLQEGIDTRTGLAHLGAFDLLGANVGASVRLYLLARVPTGPSGLILRGATSRVAVEFPELKTERWNAGEILKFDLERPAGALLLCNRDDCVPLADGASGAQPISRPPPAKKDRALGTQLYERGLREEAASHWATAFRSFGSALAADPSLSFARRHLEELRLKRRDPYRYRFEARLDQALRTFHLEPTVQHISLVAKLARGAGRPLRARLAADATGIMPDDAEGRAALDESTPLETEFNGDFENASFDGWTATGIFAQGPDCIVSGDVRRGGEGIFLAASGNAATGELRSPALAPAVDEVCFVVGGDTESVGVMLEPSGAMASGRRDAMLREACLPARPGDRIIVFDRSRDQHIWADDFSCFHKGAPVECVSVARGGER
jgi:hypothetical protein